MGTQYNKWERNAFKRSRKRHMPARPPASELACVDSDFTTVSLLLTTKATTKSAHQIPFYPVLSDSAETFLKWFSLPPVPAPR